MVRPANVALVTVSLTVPLAGYIVLHNRRLERRLPLVKKEDLPKDVTRSFEVAGRPRLNYAEGWYADIPAKSFDKSFANKVEDYARVFWTTKPMMTEWRLMQLLDKIGAVPYEQRTNPETKSQPEFTKGKPLMNGLFAVEKGLEEKDPKEIMFSYWSKTNDSPLLGGVHQLSCQKLDERTVRVWFINHLALNSKTAELKGEDVPLNRWNNWFGYDPKIVDPASASDEPIGGKVFSVALWFHRFYAKMLMDFAVREIMQRK